MTSDALKFLGDELNKLLQEGHDALIRGWDPRAHAAARDVIVAMQARLEVAYLIEQETDK